MRFNVRVFVIAAVVLGCGAVPASAQQDAHQHHAPAPPGSWVLMQDGVLFGLFNRQGGSRGDTEFVAPNWWMGMASRESGRQRLTFSGMFSLDRATVGKSGYAEIFQVGETFDGTFLVDRQHPHEFFMQLAAAWRIAFAEGKALTISGGPAAEPTLGPIAFMHRASAAGLPMAPLGHHTFDSTHVSFGVAAARLDAGRVSLEASIFNGREPDEHRWDFDFDAMDSAAARVWFRPAAGWDLQVSSGRLKDPEQLEPGNVVRTTASASWSRNTTDQLMSVTAGWGVNVAHGTRRHGLFAEATRERGVHMLSARLERQDLEVDKLLGHVEGAHDEASVTAVTLGAGRVLFRRRGWDGAVGGQLTFYRVPSLLQDAYGSSPVSAQIYFRIRLPTGAGGRMWGHTMAKGH
jgi:hypothetical protein